MWQSILGSILALGLAALLVRHVLTVMARQKAAPAILFGPVMDLLQGPRIEPGASFGAHKLIGRYRDLPVQVQTIVDTLNVRKLPSLWLMVTVPEPLPLAATFDMMMRPSGPSTFSNFDNLPVTVERHPDFPDTAVVRTDDPDHVVPAHVIAPHLGSFKKTRGKELLISPKGVRMVFQLSEGDRVRYGVFRQAEFGDVALDKAQLRDILDRLIALRADLLEWCKKTQ